ncbi:MAG: hypothetical protein IPL95_10570 [Saprospiraceae bacterium]|nr:hypothetical protein [Saprospiraceae bacterium]
MPNGTPVVYTNNSTAVVAGSYNSLGYATSLANAYDANTSVFASKL